MGARVQHTPSRSPGALTAASPSDALAAKNENVLLKARLRQMQQDFQIEQGLYSLLSVVKCKMILSTHSTTFVFPVISTHSRV